jgi:hypothetical protein
VRVYSELYTSSPPADVWKCFSDLTLWRVWSPICEDCRIADGRPLEAGSTLVMRLRLLGIRVVVPAPVVCVEPAAAIGWEFRRCGVRASHVYRLRAQGSGTLMSNEETLWGLPGPLRFLVRTWFASTDLTRRSLSGIRTLVERAESTPP